MTKANLFPYRHYYAPPSHHTWNEINPILPKTQIEVLGPPPTSGTPDVLAELALEAGCQSFSWLKAKKDKDKIFFLDGAKRSGWITNLLRRYADKIYGSIQPVSGLVSCP